MERGNIIPPQVFTTEPQAVRALAGLLVAYPEVGAQALRLCGVALDGAITSGDVRCEVGARGRRWDLLVPSNNGSRVVIEAKIDSLADAEQMRDAALAHPDAILVLLVPNATATDVQEAIRAVAAVVVEWDHLLTALNLPLAQLIAKDVDAIHRAPSSKGSQREALEAVLSASTWPPNWKVWLQAGKTGWPSLVVESPSGCVLGQLEGPRDTMAPMTFRPVIGLTEQDEKKLGRILIRCMSSFEDADGLEISYRRGDTTGRAERLGVPDWLARGYGESYVGVRLKHESSGVAAFSRLVAAGTILEAHATSTDIR